MKNAFKKRLFNILIILLILLSASIGINYIVQEGTDDDIRPYGLSTNYISLVGENELNKKYSDILGFSGESNILIISERDKISFVYDPSFYLYKRNSTMLLPTEVRYFSIEDYQLKNEYSISLQTANGFQEIENISTTGNANELMKLYKENEKNGEYEDSVTLKTIFINDVLPSQMYIDSTDKQSSPESCVKCIMLVSGSSQATFLLLQ